MIIFNFFKRIKEKREAEKAEFLRVQLIKRDIIRKDYELLKSRVDEECSNSYKESRKYADENNSTCPKCGSKKVSDRIQRLQGSISGSGSFSGSHSLFGGSYSGSSSIHGSIDTNEINNCNDCGHQWKKAEAYFPSSTYTLEHYFDAIMWLCDDYNRAIRAKINLNDIKESYKSDEEKRMALLNILYKKYSFNKCKEFFKDISLESIQYIAENEVYKSIFDSESLKLKMFNEKHNEYFLSNIMGFKHITLE